MLCTAFFSCKKENASAVEIRVQNATPFEIEKIHILGAETEMTFSSLPAGFTTGYRPIGAINFSNPQCTIYVQGQSNPFIASDNSLFYLEAGQYTCKVAYINTVPTITFIKE
jgi:hypothetical protein